MKFEELKTHWQMLQEIIHEDRYNLMDFLLYSTEENRKETESELTDRDSEQYYKYLDSLNFENKDQVEAAICEYVEYVNQQPLWMWEMGDISDMAEDYIEQRKLPFYEEED